MNSVEEEKLFDPESKEENEKRCIDMILEEE